jgi:hypothetical protein
MPLYHHDLDFVVALARPDIDSFASVNSVERREPRSPLRSPAPLAGEGLGVRGRVGEWQGG